LKSVQLDSLLKELIRQYYINNKDATQ